MTEIIPKEVVLYNIKGTPLSGILASKGKDRTLKLDLVRTYQRYSTNLKKSMEDYEFESYTIQNRKLILTLPRLYSSDKNLSITYYTSKYSSESRICLDIRCQDLPEDQTFTICIKFHNFCKILAELDNIRDRELCATFCFTSNGDAIIENPLSQTQFIKRSIGCAFNGTLTSNWIPGHIYVTKEEFYLYCGTLDKFIVGSSCNLSPCGTIALTRSFPLSESATEWIGSKLFMPVENIFTIKKGEKSLIEFLKESGCLDKFSDLLVRCPDSPQIRGVDLGEYFSCSTPIDLGTYFRNLCEEKLKSINSSSYSDLKELIRCKNYIGTCVAFLPGYIENNEALRDRYIYEKAYASFKSFMRYGGGKKYQTSSDAIAAYPERFSELLNTKPFLRNTKEDIIKPLIEKAFSDVKASVP